jgi:ATP-dependent 26S proteasome regulatory subunit
MEIQKIEDEYSKISQLKYDFELFNNIGNYFNCYRIFFSYYKTIPNIISIDEIDDILLKKWFERAYKDEIIRQHYRQDFNSEKKELEFSDHFYLLKNAVLLNIEYTSICVLYAEDQANDVKVLFEEIKKFIKVAKRTTDISLIYLQNGELNTKELRLKKPKVDFDIHYNEDFQPIHKEIVKQLNKKDVKGLYLFHGQPGTGKSTYIKYLIHQLKKKVIFISPKMAGELDNLSMTPFLLDYRNSVLVIEDAEELITSREEVRNSNLSMLLNLTDGLLGESLGIQIIATFNTDIRNIDKALLRKGRLSTIYEFKNLSIDRTNNLLQKLGHNIEVNNPMPIAEIFNFDKDNHYIPKLQKAIGFRN